MQQRLLIFYPEIDMRVSGQSRESLDQLLLLAAVCPSIENRSHEPKKAHFEIPGLLPFVDAGSIS